MALRLNGSTSGYVGIDAPATAASNTLVLPNGNGSNGQALTTNGSGTLSWTSITGSQWTTSGSDINYTAGRVLVGTTSASLGAAVIYKVGSGLQVTEPQLTVQNSQIDGSAADGPGINFANASGPVANIGSGGNGAVFIANRSSTAGSWAERMRIASDGAVFIGKTGYALGTAGIELQATGTGYFTRNGALPMAINRLSSDGTMLGIYQDTVEEGRIDVSGSTVSLIGGHLSRWSQLPSGAEREEILRGTLLSNIDEMCEWGDEENEQLNRMKVSDVEGDKNVSGVFQAWDDDDDTYTNDFFCAMTGDFIIRIGAGVTVERGDLLMSAGDGTAKPQDDDIIRSKTIAKVTSTNVSCTYEDGSYCVPCVLMAC